MQPTLQFTSLSRVGIFADLDEGELAALASELKPIPIQRGDVLVRQGDEADVLYVVVSGRFHVCVAGRDEAIAEIGPGSPIGEIAFLSGGRRTASVTAVRDSLVVRLERSGFEGLCQRIPSIWSTITATLARRLADQTAGRSIPLAHSTARTVAIVRAGAEPVPASFIQHLSEAFSAVGRTVVVRSDTVRAIIGPGDLASDAATQALNALEGRNETVLYVADPLLTAWSEKAIRQADLVLRVGFSPRDTTGPVRENVLEHFAAGLLSPGQQRLVILHGDRVGSRGARHWLSERRVAMHHHASLDHRPDVERVVRFVTGTAIGFVAGGGGAYCSAHVGVYKALIEAGVTIDMVGGTSGGGAMAAAFAMGRPPEEIDRAVDDIFVRHRALRRYTWPRYSLLDHTTFDRLLAHYYGGVDIEDLWLPFFAVSTNLSRYGLHCHRTGDVFSAVRASGSIPALLPPVYTEDGQMLVDGALISNVPVETMRSIKAGPNIVVAFEVPQLERFAVDYRALPSRGALVRRTLLPYGSKPLPDAPSLGNVLMRSLMANRQDFERQMTPQDVLLVPPLPAAIGILDWARHSEVMAMAHTWTLAEIADGKPLAQFIENAPGDASRPQIVRARRAISKP